MTGSILPTYEEALGDAEKARILFDASKGGNVRGITEDHRYELANVMQRAAEPEVYVSQDKLSIDDDMGTETYIRTIRTSSYLALRRAVRELNPGRIPIHSPYDCTGLVCWQGCKFLKVYRCYAGFYVGVVEITVSRDV